MAEHIFVLMLIRLFFWLLLMVWSLAITPAQAQLCGGGIRDLRLYTPYSQPADNLQYEVHRLAYYEASSFSARSMEDCKAELLAPATARKALAAVMSARASSKKPASVHSFSPARRVMDGVISLPTSPSGADLLIRIFSATQEIYVYASYFCTCNRDPIRLVWEANPWLIEANTITIMSGETRR
jgi:hypothetical protein